MDARIGSVSGIIREKSERDNVERGRAVQKHQTKERHNDTHINAWL